MLMPGFGASMLALLPEKSCDDKPAPASRGDDMAFTLTDEVDSPVCAIPTRHGGVWTITSSPCGLGGPGLHEFYARPANRELGSYCMKPEWNGWRLQHDDTAIDLPRIVLRNLLELSEEAEKVMAERIELARP